MLCVERSSSVSGSVVPTRVVTAGGEHVESAEPPWIAERKGAIPEVVLVRRDGWSLGSSWAQSNMARRLWAGEWAREVALVPKRRYVVAVEGEDGYLYLCPDGALRPSQAEAAMYPFPNSAARAADRLGGFFAEVF